MRRQIEHHEAYAPPGIIVRHDIANYRSNGLELAVRYPQFSVERYCRPAGDEPRRRVNVVPIARHQRAAIPECADAVVFFADPVVAEIDIAAIDISQLQRRSR